MFLRARITNAKFSNLFLHLPLVRPESNYVYSLRNTALRSLGRKKFLHLGKRTILSLDFHDCYLQKF